MWAYWEINRMSAVWAVATYWLNHTSPKLFYCSCGLRKCSMLTYCSELIVTQWLSSSNKSQLFLNWEFGLSSESQISFSLHYHMHRSSPPTTKWIWSQKHCCKGGYPITSLQRILLHCNNTLILRKILQKSAAKVCCSFAQAKSTAASGTNGKFNGHSVIRAYPHSSNTFPLLTTPSKSRDISLPNPVFMPS